MPESNEIKVNQLLRATEKFLASSRTCLSLKAATGILRTAKESVIAAMVYPHCVGDKLNSLQIILAARKINSRSYATTTQIIQQITNDTQEWR